MTYLQALNLIKQNFRVINEESKIAEALALLSECVEYSAGDIEALKNKLRDEIKKEIPPVPVPVPVPVVGTEI
jgi:hypothetical protein